MITACTSRQHPAPHAAHRGLSGTISHAPIEHAVLLILLSCLMQPCESMEGLINSSCIHSLNMLAPNQLQSLTGEPVPWSDLPADVLSVIGGLISCPSQLNSATRVCKNWNQAIPSGVERLELDMNPCGQAWGAKVEQLQRLTPALSRCKAHVSTAVPRTAFGANIRRLASKLQSIEVGCQWSEYSSGQLARQLWPLTAVAWRKTADTYQVLA